MNDSYCYRSSLDVVWENVMFSWTGPGAALGVSLVLAPFLIKQMAGFTGFTGFTLQKAAIAQEMVSVVEIVDFLD